MDYKFTIIRELHANKGCPSGSATTAAAVAAAAMMITMAMMIDGVDENEKKISL